jgi:hypothetical protein
MATSGAGHVVVGSKDGKIRLYSNKTLTQVWVGGGAGVGVQSWAWQGALALVVGKGFNLLDIQGIGCAGGGKAVSHARAGV